MWWIVVIVLAFLIPEILSTVLDSRLARAVAARIENRGAESADGGMTDRVKYLEGEVDRLSQEVQRLHEESDFLQRLLAERPPADPGARLSPGDPGD
jgi:hypothetical protein